MKKILFFCALILSIHLSDTAVAQTIYKLDGNLGFLKDDTTLNVVYDYENFNVGKLTEKEYVNTKVTNMNGESGHRGDDWLKDWLQERTELYQPAFERSLTRTLRKQKLTARGSNTDAKFTLLIRINFIEPGFWAYKVKMPSRVDIHFIFFETNNPDIILTKLSGQGFRGSGITRGTRIAGSFSWAGRVLGKYLLKNVYPPKI
jgi:hypothetical protein